ncbi:MAG: hypothetical protein ABI318_23960, partial [Chthoniobacteraceae bacterium]
GTAGEDAHPTRRTPSRCVARTFDRLFQKDGIRNGFLRLRTISKSYEIISPVLEAPSQYWPAISQTLETSPQY